MIKNWAERKAMFSLSIDRFFGELCLFVLVCNGLKAKFLKRPLEMELVDL